ncbi:MAG: IS701 family transposase [Candidatus Rokubacteria bacterium]|nr:IS701 family transposase [Candidatus Rokubacteria bacterium]
MRTLETARSQQFAAYVQRLAGVLGHRDRHEPLRAYVTGLCLPGDRKSIEPMAARVDPRHVRSRHQSMHHFIADAPWDERAVLRVARDWVLDPMARHGPVAAWIVDDTAFPKKGQHSVGVARQYCGVLGKQDNCQVAVSVSVANDAVSLPVAYQLYLPESWARDRRRRRAVGVPAAVAFQPKWQMALGQIQTLQAEGLPPAPVLADAGYGDTTAFREALTTAGLPYVVGMKKETTAWPPGEAPRPPKRWNGRGRPPTRVRRTATHTPPSLKQLAGALPLAAWRTVTWREGTRGAMRSRFARLRVRPAHRDAQRAAPRPEEWVLIEWPRGDAEPTKYWFSTLPATIPLVELVHLAKLRWRIERDSQELKDELGLDHFEGRGWRGFHHHGALCIAAYAYLAAERARVSPPAPLAFLRPARLPTGFTPRGAPGAA